MTAASVVRTTGPTRGWSDEQWSGAIAGLAARGLMTDDGQLTDEGQALRRSLETETDVSAAAPWDALGETGAARLAELGHPLVAAALANGAFPPGVFA